jgi:DNA-binding PadR family transcriptional regulator
VLEVAILYSLADSDTHGYDLFARIEALAGGLVCVDSGTMYRMLRAMEQDGLVTSSWQAAEVGPNRRVYVLTDQGFESLAAMAASLATRASAMQELAAKATQAIKESGRVPD